MFVSPFHAPFTGPCVQMKVLEFTGYGASGIKTFKVSPDAFVQMALQLAVFKMTGWLLCPPPESPPGWLVPMSCEIGDHMREKSRSRVTRPRVCRGRQPLKWACCHIRTRSMHDYWSSLVGVGIFENFGSHKAHKGGVNLVCVFRTVSNEKIKEKTSGATHRTISLGCSSTPELLEPVLQAPTAFLAMS